MNDIFQFIGYIPSEVMSKNVIFRKDFVIYREPNVSPSQVTENNFPEKVRVFSVFLKALSERTKLPS